MGKAKRSKKSTDNRAKFVAIARALDCDESEAAFSAKLKKLAKPKKEKK